MAEIEELITDMKDPQANVRFQAVVICSRAVEQIQILINKFSMHNLIMLQVFFINILKNNLYRKIS